MTKKTKATADPMGALKEVIEKLLILELFKLNLPQVEIAKKLHVDIYTVNNLLKGAKKKGSE